MSTGMTFDSIFVLQSLGDQEDATGTKLFEGTIAPGADRLGLLGELYDRIRTGDELLAVLSHVAGICEQHGRSPIIHVEAHGSRDGIRVSDPRSPLVEWAELIPPLARINRVSEMNLLVVAGMCHGINLSAILRPTDRSPAWALIGGSGPVSPEDLLDAMRLFYGQLLFTPHDFDAALSVMRSEGKGDFEVLTAERWLALVLKASFEDNERETKEQRVARLLELSFAGAVPDVNQSMLRRAEITAHLTDMEFWFHKYRQTFLMLDLFPHNRSRFPMTYEQLAEALSNADVDGSPSP